MNIRSTIVAFTLAAVATHDARADVSCKDAGEVMDVAAPNVAAASRLTVYVLQPGEAHSLEDALAPLRSIAADRPLRLVAVPALGPMETAEQRLNRIIRVIKPCLSGLEGSAPDSMLFGSDSQALVALESLLLDPSAFSRFAIVSPAAIGGMNRLYDALRHFGSESADLTLLVNRSDAPESLHLADALDAQLLARSRPRLSYHYIALH